MHLPCKLAIVTHIVPPAPFGSAVRLWRLFRDTPCEDYCILTCRDLPEGDEGRLPGRHYRLPSEWRQVREPRGVLRRPVSAVNRWLRVLQRVRNIVRIVRTESAGMIMGVSGDLFDLPSTCLAARWCRLPFIAALDDDYVYQWPDPAQRRFAARRMGWIVRRARRVIVLNELYANDLARRYDVQPAVVPNPCELSGAGLSGGSLSDVGQINVVFTGTVYHVNVDVFRAMGAALDVAGMESVSFNIHGTVISPDFLGTRRSRQFLHGGRTLDASLEAQRNADILLLPLGFASDVPDVIRTATPFKMGEYLSSGKPVVACVPEDSFVAHYFRKNECGLVVNRPEPSLLAEAIMLLRDDAALRNRLVDNARRCAVRDFELGQVRTLFKAALEDVA